MHDKNENAMYLFICYLRWQILSMPSTLFCMVGLLVKFKPMVKMHFITHFGLR